MFTGWGSTQAKAWQEVVRACKELVEQGKARHQLLWDTAKVAAEACGSFPYIGQKSLEGSWECLPVVE